MDPNNPPDEEVPAGWHRWYSERRKKYYYHNDATGEVKLSVIYHRNQTIRKTMNYNTEIRQLFRKPSLLLFQSF